MSTIGSGLPAPASAPISVSSPTTPPADIAADPDGGGTPTKISWPSLNLRARSSAVRSVCGNAPPAAAIASTIREPGGSVKTPGFATLPTTSTTSSLALDGVGRPDGRGPAPTGANPSEGATPPADAAISVGERAEPPATVR